MITLFCISIKSQGTYIYQTKIFNDQKEKKN